MTELRQSLNLLTGTSDYSIGDITQKIVGKITQAGYEIVEVNDTKPWGAYVRISGEQANEFVADFFDDLSPEEARLGNLDAELSPKILIVSPDERLSLQTHARRAERWNFLTPGFYYKGTTLDNTQLYEAQAGEVVQFKKGEIHRLCGAKKGFVIVAEIWQHSDPTRLSDEDDIDRLEDDYSRVA
ncbi:MAG: mannose-6-phosphate isomerase [Candidatus Saccharibacteria bacterium]|nr:mannose-6-phosphate isomerase [Candidatus Saccharibacteria bacterium]